MTPPLGSARAGVVSQVEDAKVVDNFEDTNSDPAGVYATNETIADYYSGDTGSFSRTTNSPMEGSHSLETQTTGNKRIVSVPGDGLLAYPEEGDSVAWLHQDNGQHGGVIFCGSYSGTVSGYEFITVVGGDDIRIRRLDDGSTTNLATQSASLSAGVVYWCEANLPTSSDGSIEYRIYDFNATDLTRGNLKATATASDTTYATERGVGMIRTSSSDTGLHADWIRVI